MIYSAWLGFGVRFSNPRVVYATLSRLGNVVWPAIARLLKRQRPLCTINVDTIMLVVIVLQFLLVF